MKVWAGRSSKRGVRYILPTPQILSAPDLIFLIPSEAGVRQAACRGPIHGFPLCPVFNFLETVGGLDKGPLVLSISALKLF